MINRLKKTGLQHEKIKEFLGEEFSRIFEQVKEKEGEEIAQKKATNRVYFKSNALKHFFAWRKITVEEFIANAEEEAKKVNDYLKAENLKENTKKIRIAVVKDFLRFLGVKIKKFERYKKLVHFPGDKELEKHINLDLGTKAQRTKDTARRNIAKFCYFRNMTPTELVQEVKENKITLHELRDLLLEFKNSLKDLQDPMLVVGYIRRFYEFRADVVIRLPPSVHTKRTRRLQKGKRITKEIFRQLVDVACLRDKMFLYCLWETGLNPVELVNLQIKDFNYTDPHGNQKNYLNIVQPEKIDYCCVVPLVRQKTKIEFYAGFGKESLKFMSRWLQLIKKRLKKELPDDFHIFTMKAYPFDRINAPAVLEALEKVSRDAGFEKNFTPSDFRNNFNTVTKNILKPFDKEVFMGHIGGIERHYDISNINYFLKEYTKAWEVCFDLTFDNLKLQTLEQNYTELKKTFLELTQIVEKLYQGLFVTDGTTTLTTNDIEKVLLKAKQIR
ncbi:MAG: hypothetical protein ACTSVS_09310 [Candidatus Heimdallarchaeota archaeon]